MKYFLKPASSKIKKKRKSKEAAVFPIDVHQVGQKHSAPG